MTMNIICCHVMVLLFFTGVKGQGPGIPGEARPPGNGPPSNPPGHMSPDDNGPVDPAALQRCLDNQVRTNPTIRDRYHSDLLEHICRRNVMWQSQYANNTVNNAPRRANFTQGQLAWLKDMYDCQNNANCLCQRANTCIDQTGQRKLRKPNETDSQAVRSRSRRQNLVVDDFLQERAGRSFRREIRQLSDGERGRYFQALNTLKFDRVDGMSKYDILVVYHTPEYAPEAHFGGALLPFHREMLKNFEIVLRMVDPGVSLPYWDTTMDAMLPTPADSMMWTDGFYGNGVGDVTSGPFRNWVAMRDSQITLSRSGRLVRNLGSQGSLLSDRDINVIMGKRSFRNLVFCVDPFLETAHGANHMWVGGHMLTLRVSVNDPIFFSLHAFIDSIWERWRWTHQNFNQREDEYVSNNEACNQASALNARMQPFPVINSDGLSNRYTQDFYTYSARPSCPNCGSPYLFCYPPQNKCIAKVRPGGNCNGFEGYDVCFNSVCTGGRCSAGGGSAFNAPNNFAPSAVRSGGCQNNHACCVYWASIGECSTNPAWMRSSCGPACGLCSGGNSCGDSNPMCSTWASQGECQSNSVWMTVSCQASCRTCNRNAGASECTSGRRGASAETTNTDCRNTDNRCSRWANRGECTTNPTWMEPNCALACRAC